MGEQPLDVVAHNRRAWDRQVAMGNRWTVPVPPEVIAAARRGDWSIVLTPTKPVPREWLGDVRRRDVLALASGGGQQAPVLAAAGAHVTVLDNSPAQLQRDRQVAERERLTIRLELGDMRDLSRFAGESFDLVVHPVANVFCPEVRPVWRECFRVLRPGGRLLAGFCNPALFLFDEVEGEDAPLVARHALPWSDPAALPGEVLEKRIETGEPLEFGHTLADQIGGQCEAGFAIAGLYEDALPGAPLDRLMPPMIATLALKPARGEGG